MHQFIETIKIKNGKFQNLSFHLQRMKNTIMDFFNIDFITNIDNLQIPEIYINDVVKCRIIYSSKIDSIEFLNYEIKKINKLKIIEDNNIEYDYKFLNRQRLDYLYNLRNDCDEIIISKNGLITDTSYSNIVLEKKGKYYTPNTPLLKGTKRDFYLKKKIIVPITISIDNLFEYENIRLINSMIDLEESPIIKISKENIII